MKLVLKLLLTTFTYTDARPQINLGVIHEDDPSTQSHSGTAPTQAVSWTIPGTRATASASPSTSSLASIHDPAEIIESVDIVTDNSDPICNENDQVFWPENGECYNLLEQGPCDNGQWLELNTTGPARARCVGMPCGDPERQVYWARLCQCVDIDNTVRSGRYTPEDVCGPNTRLVWSPYGQGLCSCEVGFFMDAEGHCYALGTQGPCGTGLVWENLAGELKCVNPELELDVRVFDLVAHDDRRAQVVKCYQDSRGNCRKPLGLNVNSRFQKSEFEEWVESFTPKNEDCMMDTCENDQLLWIDGLCYQVASSGPCGPSQWLLLHAIIDGRPILRCTKKKCPDAGQVWWDKSCGCVDSDPQGRQDLVSSVCGGPGFRLLTDPYGKGVCGCQDGFQLDQANQCAPTNCIVKEVGLVRFGGLASASGVASSLNCNISAEGFCSKVIIDASVGVGNKTGSVEDLISWMDSFPKPNPDCDKNSLSLRILDLEQECFEKEMVLYEGACVELYSSGPCRNQSQWILMSREANRLTASCQPKPCPSSQAFLQRDCQCHTADSSVCGSSEELYINVYGYGICSCRKDHVIYPPDGKCYPVNEQGPCEAERMLVPTEAGDGVCRDCTQGLSKLEKDTVLNSSKSMGTNLNEEGLLFHHRRRREVNSSVCSCFRVGDKGPCPDGFLVGQSAASSEIKCVPSPDSGAQFRSANVQDAHITVATPNTCTVDSRGRCRRPAEGQPAGQSLGVWLDTFLPWAPEPNRCTAPLDTVFATVNS